MVLLGMILLNTVFQLRIEVADAGPIVEVQLVAEIEGKRSKKVRAIFRPVVFFILKIRTVCMPKDIGEELRVRYVSFRAFFCSGTDRLK